MTWNRKLTATVFEYLHFAASPPWEPGGMISLYIIIKFNQLQKGLTNASFTTGGVATLYIMFK